MSRIWAISRAHPLRISRLRIGPLLSVGKGKRDQKKFAFPPPMCTVGSPCHVQYCRREDRRGEGPPILLPLLPHATNPLIPMAFSLLSLCLRQRRVCAIVVYICTVHTHTRTNLTFPFPPQPFFSLPFPFPFLPILFYLLDLSDFGIFPFVCVCLRPLGSF